LVPELVPALLVDRPPLPDSDTLAIHQGLVDIARYQGSGGVLPDASSVVTAHAPKILGIMAVASDSAVPFILSRVNFLRALTSNLKVVPREVFEAVMEFSTAFGLPALAEAFPGLLGLFHDLISFLRNLDGDIDGQIWLGLSDILPHIREILQNETSFEILTPAVDLLWDFLQTPYVATPQRMFDEQIWDILWERLRGKGPQREKAVIIGFFEAVYNSETPTYDEPLAWAFLVAKHTEFLCVVIELFGQVDEDDGWNANRIFALTASILGLILGRGESPALEPFKDPERRFRENLEDYLAWRTKLPQCEARLNQLKLWADQYRL
jgi:hypothetical protein